MRKLVYAINLTIDGCCDHTKMSGSDETFDYVVKLLNEADILLYGRKTYQLMVPYWPDIAKNNSGDSKLENEFAQTFDAVPRIIVFSRSLEKAEGKAKILRTNLKEEILKLKQEQGKNILVGGVDLPSQLIQLGLVDEFHFVIHPVLVGEGRRLLDNIIFQKKSQLDLVDSNVFPSGTVALHFSK